MTIDRNSPLPLYYQLKKLLLDLIDQGQLKAGDIFPTELQIQEQYDVSRTTVRQALAELESEGKITRHRGRGTFVAKPKIVHNPDEYPNLDDNMLRQGLVPGWKVLSAQWIAPTHEIVHALNLTAEQRVFCLQRLRLEDETPIGVHHAYVTPYFAMAVDESSFMLGGSLRYLRSLPELENSIADRTLEALEASEVIARLLQIRVGAAVLQVTRTIYTSEKQPIEFFRGIYRGDRFAYHINHMRAISPVNA